VYCASDNDLYIIACRLIEVIITRLVWTLSYCWLFVGRQSCIATNTFVAK